MDCARDEELDAIFKNRSRHSNGLYRVIPKNTVVIAIYQDWTIHVGVAAAIDQDGYNSSQNPHRTESELNDQIDIRWCEPVGDFDETREYRLIPVLDTFSFDTVYNEQVLPIPGAFLRPDNTVTIPETLKGLVTQLLSGQKLQCCYTAEKKLYDERKIAVNKHLAALAEESRWRCEMSNLPTAALFLDAETAFTTKTLLKQTEYSVSKLYAPNDDAKVCAAIENAHPGINAPCMEVGEFQRKFELPLFLSFAWIDGVSTFMGAKNSKRSTCNAVRNLFVRNLLAPYAVVAFTASGRGLAGGHRAEHERCMKLVKPWIFKAKFKIVSSSFVSTGTVFTTIIVISKRTFRE